MANRTSAIPLESLAIERNRGSLDTNQQSLTVSSQILGSAGIEDIRFVELEERVFVIRDIYLNGSPADISVGRAIPVPLEDPNATSDTSAGKPRISGLQAAASAPKPLFRSEIDGVSNCSPGVLNGLEGRDPTVQLVSGTTYDGSRCCRKRAMIRTTFTHYWIVNGNSLATRPVHLRSREYPYRYRTALGIRAGSRSIRDYRSTLDLQRQS